MPAFTAAALLNCWRHQSLKVSERQGCGDEALNYIDYSSTELLEHRNPIICPNKPQQVKYFAPTLKERCKIYALQVSIQLHRGPLSSLLAILREIPYSAISYSQLLLLRDLVAGRVFTVCRLSWGCLCLNSRSDRHRAWAAGVLARPRWPPRCLLRQGMFRAAQVHEC